MDPGPQRSPEAPAYKTSGAVLMACFPVSVCLHALLGKAHMGQRGSIEGRPPKPNSALPWSQWYGGGVGGKEAAERGGVPGGRGFRRLKLEGSLT